MTASHWNSPIQVSILGFLKTSTFHSTAEEIYAAIRQHHPLASFATVYRNLSILVELNLAERLESLCRGSDRFDARALSHTFLRCDEYGSPLPLTPASLSRKPPADYIRYISKLNSCGVCAECKT